MDKASVTEWMIYAKNDLDAAKHLLTLTSQPRYPFGLEIIESDMRLALKDSSFIYEFIKTKIIYDDT